MKMLSSVVAGSPQLATLWHDVILIIVLASSSKLRFLMAEWE